NYAPVAQLDRALACGAKGRRFKSCRVYQENLRPPRQMVFLNSTRTSSQDLSHNGSANVSEEALRAPFCRVYHCGIRASSEVYFILSGAVLTCSNLAFIAGGSFCIGISHSLGIIISFLSINFGV